MGKKENLQVNEAPKYTVDSAGLRKVMYWYKGTAETLRVCEGVNYIEEPLRFDGYQYLYNSIYDKTGKGYFKFEGYPSVKKLYLPETCEKFPAFLEEMFPNLEEVYIPEDCLRTERGYSTFISFLRHAIQNRITIAFRDGSTVGRILDRVREFPNDFKRRVDDSIIEEMPFDDDSCEIKNVYMFPESSMVYLEIPKETDYVKSVFYTIYENKMLVNKTLKSVKMSQNAQLMSGAFRWCCGLETVLLSDATLVIPERCFSGCKKLKQIHLPDGCKIIEKEAFSECPSLQSVYIPKGIEEIADTAFAKSSKVTIFSQRGTIAETFAQKHQLPFVELDTNGRPVPKADTKKNESLDTSPLEQFRRIYDAACFDGEYGLNYPYVSSDYSIDSYVPRSNADFSAARKAVLSIGPFGADAAMLWDECVHSSEPYTINPHVLFETHYKIAFAIAVAIKAFICPDVKVVLGFTSSKWSDKTSERWVLSTIEPGGKILSSAQYSAYKLKAVFPLEFSLKFDAPQTEHESYCSLAETLKMGDELKIRILPKCEQYRPCVMLYKDDHPVGHLGNMWTEGEEYRAIKKHEKKLVASIVEAKPLSVRSKGTKNPLIKVRVDLKH